MKGFIGNIQIGLKELGHENEEMGLGELGEKAGILLSQWVVLLLAGAAIDRICDYF